MRIAVLITARLGSTRLPKKHLLPANGRPILQYLVDSITREFKPEITAGVVVLAIATSERPENRAFESTINGCEVFAGSDGNIPFRHLQAAEHFDADAILSVDGDDILCSPRAMRIVFDALQTGASLAKTEGLPLGMNASGYSTSALRNALANFEYDSIFETGWGRVFEGVPVKSVKLDFAAADNLRFTLDYEEDYLFFTALLGEEAVATRSASDAEIIALVLSRHLDAITKPVVDEYWKNFYGNIEIEKRRRIE